MNTARVLRFRNRNAHRVSTCCSAYQIAFSLLCFYRKRNMCVSNACVCACMLALLFIFDITIRRTITSSAIRLYTPLSCSLRKPHIVYVFILSHQVKESREIEQERERERVVFMLFENRLFFCIRVCFICAGCEKAQRIIIFMFLENMQRILVKIIFIEQ